MGIYTVQLWYEVWRIICVPISHWNDLRDSNTIINNIIMTNSRRDYLLSGLSWGKNTPTRIFVFIFPCTNHKRIRECQSKSRQLHFKIKINRCPRAYPRRVGHTTILPNSKGNIRKKRSVLIFVSRVTSPTRSYSFPVLHACVAGTCMDP